MVDYDVIVAGAGPAGAMVTRELAEREFNVLCIEREFEIGYPNKSTAATPLETFEQFDIPRKVAFDDITGWRIFAPSTSYTSELRRPMGRLLMFREMRQYLIRKAIRLGADVQLGTAVTKPILKDGTISGVSVSGPDGEKNVTATVVVDATGPDSALATKLGIWKKRPDILGTALEYFLEGATPYFDKGLSLDFYVGNHVAPGGYGWIFGTQRDQVKAGMCKLNPGLTVPGELSQKGYLDRLWKADGQIKDAQPFEIHKCAHYITGGVWDCTRDNFVAIGDSVNKVNPIFGEGNRPAFYSARFAAEAIEQARKKDDYSKKSLSLFDTLWEKRWGTYIRFSKILFDIFYSSDDRQLDKFVGGMTKLDGETWLKLYLGEASPAEYRAFFRVMPQIATPHAIATFLKGMTSR